MKKVITILCSLALVFGLVGVANALPTSWTVMLDWSPDPLLSDVGPLREWQDGFSYYHDLGDAGFVPLLEGGNDVVSSYALSVRLYDNYDNNEEM